MKKTIIQSLIDHIISRSLMSENDTILIGLSGGPDSVFLLHLLIALRAQMPITLIAAHLNHEWRETADRDETFCKILCEQLNVRLITKRMSELIVAHRYNGSDEAYARQARRTFFETCLSEAEGSKIALAHHLNDQEETFFIRLARGTSVSGLVGMKEQDGAYIRPLLSVPKTVILDYLHEHHIAYCIDETNNSLDYLRNRIRLQLMPLCNQIDPRFTQNISRMMQRLAETDDYLEQHTRELLSSISQVDNGFLYVNREKLLQLHPTMQYRCILHWLIASQVKFNPSQAFFDEILRFFMNDGSRHHIINNSWKLLKNNGFICIEMIVKSAHTSL